MAGLLTARVLSEFYGSVTVLERDALPDHPAHRKGTPQGRHLHNFLSRGPQVIAELFPGLLGELVAAGAVVVDHRDLSRIYARIGRYELMRTGDLTDPQSLTLYQASRPFMEFHARRRVRALHNVTILANHEAAELLTASGAVIGVHAVDRATGAARSLNADLTVDVTGRATRTPQFLQDSGFGAPPEVRTPAAWGYSSQQMYIPPGRIAEQLVFVNQGAQAPGGLLVAQENNTWMLAIARAIRCGLPPTDFAEALTVAEQILPASIMAGLREAIPTADIAISRNTASLWRRYDQMPRFPAGLLVLGDAICHVNPLYGQGMTMAAVQALQLRDCLRHGDADLAQRFFASAAGHIGPVWAVNKANDSAAAAGSVTERSSSRLPIRGWIGDAVLNASARDIRVAERFLRVRNLIDPPDRLRDPALLVRVLVANLQPPRNAARRWHRRGERVNTGIAVRTDDGRLIAASQNTPHRRVAATLMALLRPRQGRGSNA
jgi:2-polyprenyl-6-methoxyphenol hydroxylase-like FAD-dependent oxidoreductase